MRTAQRRLLRRPLSAISRFVDEVPTDIEWHVSDEPVPYDDALRFMPGRLPQTGECRIMKCSAADSQSLSSLGRIAKLDEQNAQSTVIIPSSPTIAFRSSAGKRAMTDRT